MDEVLAGEPVLLTHKGQMVKMERFEIQNPEENTPELEAVLVQAVQGPHKPYSSEAMRARLERIIRRHRRARK